MSQEAGSATGSGAPAVDSQSSSSSADDYEIIPRQSEQDNSSSNSSRPEMLHISVGQGKEEDLRQKLQECLQSPEGDSDLLSSEQQEQQGNEEEGDVTVFHKVIFLGSRMVSEPKNEDLIQSCLRETNRSGNSQEPDKTFPEIALSVPKTSDGSVVLREEKDSKPKVIQRFPICRIIFFARGNADTEESSCFAFTCVHGGSDDEPEVQRHFRVHMFRCEIPEAVAKVFVSFAGAFKRAHPVKLAPSENYSEQEPFLFEVTLELREREEGRQHYDLVPRQKGLFKLRSNIEKKVVVTVQQISRNSCHLNVERCFGMLVSPGRNVRHADMQLLEHVTMATTTSNSNNYSNRDEAAPDSSISHVITGTWDPSETAFAVLNKETPAEVHHVYVTIACDLVIQQVAEPVRFVIETKARIYPSNEKYWYYAKKNLAKQYQVRLKRSSAPQGDKVFDVCGIDVSEEIERGRSLTSQFASFTISTLTGSFKNPMSATGMGAADIDFELSSPREEEEEDDGEEPLLSGFGEVSKDCSGTELEQWSQVLQEWDRDNPLQYPKQLAPLVRRGIPEALRGEVWQRVTGASVQMDDIIETYRILTTKESPDEKVILRDIHRTFPAHEFFKEAGGVGQEALYRISKAYSVYDSEIGYCQGQSFLIAALLLQMPEEQSFGVLVQLMHRHGLRDMFKENFEQLQLRLYQLDRLIEVILPDLWQHFQDNGIESHMYASQWFLTIFTAKFPLFLVFRVLDCFLLFGFDSVFQVALGILKVSRKDMLQLDFEGLMKYFRVNIPKRYRSEENAKHLMAVASGIKLKKLSKYEKEWLAIKAAERAREDPVVRLERENKKLLSDNLRLDTENDNLARQLVNSKIEMRKEIDAVEDDREVFEKELQTTKLQLHEANEEKRRLQGETESLKAVLKREVDKLDAELATRNNVIAEYKMITAQLSEKLEKAQKQKRGDTVNNETVLPVEASTASDEASAHGNALERVRELELELAQTKLALVETECKNQDLTHQFHASLQQMQQQTGGGLGLGGGNSGRTGSTWLSKTLSSIKETATASAAAAVSGQASSSMRKSSSIDVIKSAASGPVAHPD